MHFFSPPKARKPSPAATRHLRAGPFLAHGGPAPTKPKKGTKKKDTPTHKKTNKGTPLDGKVNKKRKEIKETQTHASRTNNVFTLKFPHPFRGPTNAFRRSRFPPPSPGPAPRAGRSPAGQMETAVKPIALESPPGSARGRPFGPPFFFNFF